MKHGSDTFVTLITGRLISTFVNCLYDVIKLNFMDYQQIEAEIEFIVLQ